MKSKNKFLRKILTMLLLVFVFTLNANANNNNKGKGKGDNPYENHGPKKDKDKGNGHHGNHGPKKDKDKPVKGGDSVPLDGGLGILLAGAAFYGVKKLRKN